MVNCFWIFLHCRICNPKGGLGYLQCSKHPLPFLILLLPLPTRSYHLIYVNPPYVATKNTLLSNSPDTLSKARLLAEYNKESRIWLNTLPIYLGLHIDNSGLHIDNSALYIDNSALRIEIGLHLGLPLCWTCKSDSLSITWPWLNAREWCHNHHASVNNIPWSDHSCSDAFPHGTSSFQHIWMGKDLSA